MAASATGAALVLLSLALARASAAAPASAATCHLHNYHVRADVALGFPRIANRMRSRGRVRASVLFVDFPDVAADRTPAETLAIVAPAAAWYREVSYGRFDLDLHPFLRVLRMPRPSTDYSFRTAAGQRHYLAVAAQLAEAAGFDFSDSDTIVVMDPPSARALPDGPAFCATPGKGFNASGRTFENSLTSGADFDYWGHKWLNHEMGHTMALVDLYSYSAAVAEFGFTGEWSIMGDIAGRGGGYFGWERWLLDWLPDAGVACLAAAGNSTVALAALASSGGAANGTAAATRIVVAKIGDHLAVAAELRVAQGVDANVTRPGVLVYVVDTARASGNGTLRVLPLATADRTMLSSTLAALGESRAFGGVTVTLLAIDLAAGTALIGVDTPGAPPDPPRPAAAPAPTDWAKLAAPIAVGALVLAACLAVFTRLAASGCSSVGGSGRSSSSDGGGDGAGAGAGASLAAPGIQDDGEGSGAYVTL